MAIPAETFTIEYQIVPDNGEPFPIEQMQFFIDGVPEYWAVCEACGKECTEGFNGEVVTCTACTLHFLFMSGDVRIVSFNGQPIKMAGA
jgi:DNA-directed RNA polymerase subunit RPC12/RpoP